MTVDLSTCAFHSIHFCFVYFHLFYAFLYDKLLLSLWNVSLYIWNYFVLRSILFDINSHSISPMLTPCVVHFFYPVNFNLYHPLRINTTKFMSMKELSVNFINLNKILQVGSSLDESIIGNFWTVHFFSYLFALRLPPSLFQPLIAIFISFSLDIKH